MGKKEKLRKISKKDKQSRKFTKEEKKLKKLYKKNTERELNDGEFRLWLSRENKKGQVEISMHFIGMLANAIDIIAFKSMELAFLDSTDVMLFLEYNEEDSYLVQRFLGEEYLDAYDTDADEDYDEED